MINKDIWERAPRLEGIFDPINWHVDWIGLNIRFSPSLSISKSKLKESRRNESGRPQL